MLGIGYVILLWHSLSLPYNYFVNARLFSFGFMEEKIGTGSSENQKIKIILALRQPASIWTLTRDVETDDNVQ